MAVFLIGSAVTASVIMAAILVVRSRDKWGHEATVDTSEPSTVNIGNDGGVSIVPMRNNEKAKAAESGKRIVDGPALKDFSKTSPAVGYRCSGQRMIWQIAKSTSRRRSDFGMV